MTLPYKKVLVIGATSGIGRALAEKMLASGQSVIAVGRRKENLDSFVKAHGKEKASSFQFDITALDTIPQFVQKFVLSLHVDFSD
jgi:NADP-dependent 3-hydroxy acid dehydrogenase YdfG